MTAPVRSRGFTLLELFAVILILALLLALLLPMLHRSDHRGTRNTCANNMRNVGLSLVNLETVRSGFPGYANMIHDKRASWVVPILPHLERDDLYQAWKNVDPVSLPLPQGSTPNTLENSERTSNPWAASHLYVLLCPNTSAYASKADTISYVVNCGSARTANDFFPPIAAANTWMEDRNSGVFFNRARADYKLAKPNPNPPADAFAPDDGPVMTIDFIAAHDGTPNTIMLSENLQATTWATDPTDTTHRPPYPFQSEFQIKQNTGFVWFITGNKDNAGPGRATAAYNPAGIGINQLSDVSTPVPTQAYPIPGSDPPNGGLAYARPSSNHPGGVNVIFCDGHLQFISEEIDYRVYTQLMTPNGKEVIVELPDITAEKAGWDYQLRDADY